MLEDPVHHCRQCHLWASDTVLYIYIYIYTPTDAHHTLLVPSRHSAGTGKGHNSLGKMVEVREGAGEPWLGASQGLASLVSHKWKALQLPTCHETYLSSDLHTLARRLSVKVW